MRLRLQFSISLQTVPQGSLLVSGDFFTHCWEIVADDVVAAVQDFFSGGCLPRGYTSSFLALIPKTEDASKFSEFRPVSFHLKNHLTNFD